MFIAIKTFVVGVVVWGRWNLPRAARVARRVLRGGLRMVGFHACRASDASGAGMYVPTAGVPTQWSSRP